MPIPGFSGLRFPFRTPSRPFSSLSVGKASIATPNSLTRSPSCEPSVPTAYSYLERSPRAGFGFFRSPVPVPDPQRDVSEPKCQKSLRLRSKLPNRESYLRAVICYRLHSSRAKCPCRFSIFPVSGSRSVPPADGPFSSLSVGKASLFAAKSLSGSPIRQPSVPTGYSHLERSPRSGFGFFLSPVPVPYAPAGGLFSSQSVGKASFFAPNSLTGSPICDPSVPTGYSHL